MRRLNLALVGVMMLVAGGCSSGGHSRAVPTTTTQPAGPNPDVVPAVITPAYVNAVFAVLEHVDGNASRTLIESKSVTPQVIADIRAIYNDPLYSQEIRIAQQSRSTSSADLLHPVGDVRITVRAILSESPTCIFVETNSDYSAVLVKPETPAASEYWMLRLKQPGADPSRLNSTPWALSFNADFLTPTTIPNQCVAS
ncbi:MAG TPA: hypothetical protein VG435_03210 [Acidimicrobiales bacterium]|jgi:hypothetical protein|nr:hypothetical protein [Acidimicrobiales bacterium]